MHSFLRSICKRHRSSPPNCSASSTNLASPVSSPTALHPPDGAFDNTSSQGSEVGQEQHFVDFWCWGWWGNKRIQEPFRPWVTKPFGIRTDKAIVAGKFFVVLTASGELHSWGMDVNGCLGLG